MGFNLLAQMVFTFTMFNQYLIIGQKDTHQPIRHQNKRKLNGASSRFISPVPQYSNHITMNQSQLNSDRVNSTLRNQMRQREDIQNKFMDKTKERPQ